MGRSRLAITAAVTGQFILAPEAYFKDVDDVLPCLKCSGHKSPFASYLRVQFPVERVEEAGDMSKVRLCGEKFEKTCVCVSPTQAKNTQ